MYKATGYWNGSESLSMRGSESGSEVSLPPMRASALLISPQEVRVATAAGNSRNRIMESARICEIYPPALRLARLSAQLVQEAQRIDGRELIGIEGTETVDQRM